MKRTLIHNADIVSGGKPRRGWLLIEGERIKAMGNGEAPDSVALGAELVDAEGDLLLPGMIDTHVHFRDPGLTRKADIASESAAALAGGVTSFIDMPNTVPPTTSLEAWERKMEHAAEASLANYAFYLGATNTNLDSDLLRADYSRVPGVKLFLGSSTGNLLVDSRQALERLFAEVEAPIAVHAEDNARIALHAALAREVFGEEEVPVEFHPVIRDAQACLSSALTAMELAAKHGARLHLLHVSTSAEAKLLRAAKPDWLTAETCIHYLTFADTDYADRGTRIKCNPAIKGTTDRSALRKAVKEGVIDTIGSDHAPHLREEKQGDALTAPSGMPGIQFQLPLLLDLFTPQRVAELTATRPAEIFGIEERGRLAEGMYADVVRIKREPHTITADEVMSRCGWTPYEGMECGHKVVSTWLNGTLAYHEGVLSTVSILSTVSRPLKFKKQRKNV